MMTQAQVSKTPARTTPSEAATQAEEDAVRQAQEKEQADQTLTDELLQDIDDLLDEVIGEGTAQEFVDNFKQKGGE